MSVEEHEITERIHHLENLLAFSLNNRSVATASLPALAAEVMGAERCLILMSNLALDQLYPALGSEVPPEFLQCCGEYLVAISASERSAYFADDGALTPIPPDQIAQEAAILNAKSYLRLPFAINHQRHGILVFSHTAPNVFALNHLGRFIATLAGKTIENQLLQERYQITEAYQQSAYRMSLLINDDHLNLSQVLNEVISEMLHLAQSDNTVLVLLVDEDHALRVAAEAGAVRILREGDRIPLNQAPSTLVENYVSYETALQRAVDQNCAGRVLGAPLINHESLTGMLAVVRLNTPRDSAQASIDDQEMLELLAPLAATAIEKAQLRDSVRQERSQLHALLDHIRAPILVIKGDGTLEMANPEAHNVGKRLGISIYSHIGWHVRDILARLPGEIKIPDNVLMGVPTEVDLGDGGEFVVRVGEVPKSYSGTENYVLVAQEITKERRLAHAKSELLYILSHDLGNILTLGLGYAGLALEEDFEEEEYKFTMKKVYEALIRARALIRDVVALDQSYGDSVDGRVMRPYSLHELIDEVCHVYLELALDKQQVLTWDFEQQPPQMTGNVPLIKQALENLIANAIKYTLENGRVTVKVYVQGENAFVDVKDSGLGIAPEALPHIWDRYYRAEAHKQLHIPGTGLGLSLVMSVIKAHKGNVEVESEVGKGSTFRVSLPIKFPKNDTGT